MSARRPTAPRSGARSSGSAGAGQSSHRPRSTGGATSSAARGTGRTTGVERAPVARLPRMFTVRAMVLFVVGMLAFVLLFPTVRAYVAQRADNARLAEQVAQARSQNVELEAELERWNDDAFVAAQARERLAYVRPGETAFRVVDPESVPDPGASDVVAAGSGPALVPEGTTKPWYNTVWESVRVAGEAKVGQPGTTKPAAPVDPTTDPVP